MTRNFQYWLMEDRTFISLFYNCRVLKITEFLVQSQSKISFKIEATYDNRSDN